MKKTLILMLSILLLGSSAYAALGKDTKGPFGYNLYDDINRGSKDNAKKEVTQEQPTVQPQTTTPKQIVQPKVQEEVSTSTQTKSNNDWEISESYYPNASIGSAINKYKQGNYSGSLQELISVSKKDPYNPLVLYYLGLAYTQVGNPQQAVNAYEEVINLNSNATLSTYSKKGIDCIIGGPTCREEKTTNEDDLDRFVNSPYGNGLSDELNQQMKKQQLRNIEKRIKTKDVLEADDIKNIHKFDNHKGEANIDETKLAMADEKQVSNEDVLSAIETLKKAGVTVSINPYQTQMPMNDEYAQLSMMLGGNNNNNNSMMNMLPMLMTQNKGQLDPQVVQAMMMNSMLPDFNFDDNKKDY